MLSNKVGQIISKIHKATLTRQVKWQQFGKDKRFQVAFANSSVIISEEFDREEGQSYPALSLFNDEGVKILEVHGGNVEQYLPEETYKILEEILESAESSILKKDETFDDIIRGLDSVTVSPSASVSPSAKSSSSRSSSSTTTTTATTTTTTKPPKQI